MNTASAPARSARRLALSRVLAAALLLASALCVGACRTPAVQQPPAEDGFFKAMRTSRSAPEPPRSSGGRIDRSEVVTFLDMGPSHLLRNVPVSPVLDGQDLLGYKVESFFQNDLRFASIDIAPGDVVTAVNGVHIERPEDLFQVWEDLRTAPRLQLDVIRGKTLRTMTWEIIDENVRGNVDSP